MASFIYSARDSTGAAIGGTLMADSIDQAAQNLRQEGKYPTAIRPAQDGPAVRPRGRAGVRVSRAEVIQFALELSIMVETGVTLSEALDCIAVEQEKPNMRRLVQDLCQQVQSGTDFSAALARHPRSFPRLFIALIKASEKSGMLAKLLTRATTYLRDEQEIIRKVRGALTYPAIMFCFACSTTIFLLTFVLPKFTAIYAAKAAALPTPTRSLLAVSGFILNHAVALPLMVIALACLALIYFTSPQGSRLWHFVQLRLPLMGPMFRQLYLARSLRMVGTMASAGVNLVDCVHTAHDLSTNSYFRDLWQEISQEIQAGKQLSEPMFRSPLVPRAISQMIRSGEKSGKLAYVMEQIAGFSEQELKERITETTRYIEPLMIMVMGAIIGSVTLALMLPIFTISRVIAR